MISLVAASTILATTPSAAQNQPSAAQDQPSTAQNQPSAVQSQSAASHSQTQVTPAGALTVGGYGEVALTRNFFSDNVYRYSKASEYSDAKGHGRFDIPHAVIYLGYDFGKGWTMQTEIEFEHTGTGSAVEKEFTEAGEWETEIEKGGEVELEQFWLQKSFFPQLNVRMGHIIVPVGGLNNAHEPLNFFTVYRPEGEFTILPSTWHDTGISVWGKAGAWKYEALMVAGLDAFMFDRDNFIKNGAGSPFEFKVANTYCFAARVDNTSISNLRLSLSGYAGNSMHNTYPNDLTNTRYADIKGTTLVGSFDFQYKSDFLTVRGNYDYGTVSDASTISTVKRNLTANNAPYRKLPVGSAAMAAGLEAGYDVLHLFHAAGRAAGTTGRKIGTGRAVGTTGRKTGTGRAAGTIDRNAGTGRAAGTMNRKGPIGQSGDRLYLFGRYEYYDSYIPAKDQQEYGFTQKHRMAVGINWFPLPQIAVKAEYSRRFLKSMYNDEPSVSIGIAYMGFFNH